MVLPAGFSLPPAPYLIGLLAGIAIVTGLVWRTRPRITEPVIMAFVPWMLVGSGLHVIYQLGAASSLLLPLFGTPAVYVTTFIIAGGVWLVTNQVSDQAHRGFGGSGILVFLGVVLALLIQGDQVRPGWSLIGLVLAGLIAGIAWIGMKHLRPTDIQVAPQLASIVIFGHAVDGVSTAIGIDILGFGERTPASRLILEAAALLPTADVIGVGWLFVLVKVGLAVFVVHLLADIVREKRAQGLLLLGGIAAVGLGPGVHNLLLYIVR